MAAVCIVPGLYIGPETEIQGPETYRHVLSLGPFTPRSVGDLAVCVDDTAHTNLAPLLVPLAVWIHSRILDGGSVFVHCVAGISRSSTVCLAYLLLTRCSSLSDAFRHLLAVYPRADPNPGFRRQLDLLDSILHSSPPSSSHSYSLPATITTISPIQGASFPEPPADVRTALARAEVPFALQSLLLAQRPSARFEIPTVMPQRLSPSSSSLPKNIAMIQQQDTLYEPIERYSAYSLPLSTLLARIELPTRSVRCFRCRRIQPFVPAIHDWDCRDAATFFDALAYTPPLLAATTRCLLTRDDASVLGLSEEARVARLDFIANYVAGGIMQRDTRIDNFAASLNASTDPTMVVSSRNDQPILIPCSHCKAILGQLHQFGAYCGTCFTHMVPMLTLSPAKVDVVEPPPF